MAQRAVKAVLEGTKSCLRARNNLWLQTIIDDKLFRHNEYSPKDYWPFPVDLKPLVYECPTCCGSLSIKYDKKKELMPPKPLYPTPERKKIKSNKVL